VSKLRVHNFSVSLDGYGAGPSQDPENPLGRGGLALHEWLTRTRTFRQAFGNEDGATGTDDDFAARGFEHIGAWILGRNMFGPVRGDWPDDRWKGWWGDSPPYHTDVFVLTHHAREPAEMNGRHDVLFRHRGHSRRAGASHGGRKRKGRQAGRRRRHDPTVPAGPSPQRNARRDRTGDARSGRTLVRRDRQTGPWIRLH
jgi:dihydrofolate reductase